MANPPLILLIDDDPNFREIFSTKLEALGFKVEIASDANEGMAKAKKIKPNLILMDVQMSGVNGIEAMIKLKEDPKTRDIPILFLTVLGDPRVEIQEINRRLSREVGAVGYLKKTDDLDSLVAYIQGFIK